MRKVLFVLLVVALGFVAYKYFKHTSTDTRDAELVVDFADDVSQDYIDNLGNKFSIDFRKESKYTDIDKVYIGHYYGNDNDIVETLRKDSHVEAADRESLFYIPEHSLPILAKPASTANKDFPNDPRRAEQWGLSQVHLPQDWKDNAGKGVVVAVIDTGVSKTQDMNTTSFVKGYNFIANNEDADDDNGHGTHVAGTIAQSTNNGIGVAGIAYKASIMPLKVLSAEGSGSTAAITQAIHYAADHGAKVINMSLGGGGYNAVMAKAVKYAHDKGLVVVCAAGNSSRGVVSYPAKYPGAIAVAATRKDERVTAYSNWGKEITISAPGGDGDRNKQENGILQNTIVDGKDDYYWFNGTSMATPHIAGIAALIVGVGITDPDSVKDIMIQTARVPVGMKDKPSDYAAHYGAGLIDASAAVNKAKSYTSTHKVSHKLIWLGVFVLAFVGIRYWQKWKKK